jgi:hypothetical protein
VGCHQPARLTRFADLRKEDFDDWDEARYKWIGLTREIALGRDDDDTVLCAFLYFGEATGDEPSGTVVCRLENLDEQLGRFLGDAHVARLLALRPSRVTAFATEVG